MVVSGCKGVVVLLVVCDVVCVVAVVVVAFVFVFCVRVFGVCGVVVYSCSCRGCSGKWYSSAIRHDHS